MIEVKTGYQDLLGIPYDYFSGPSNSPDIPDKVNCLWVVQQMLYRRSGILLPREQVLPREMFEDEMFESVPLAEATEGDIFRFGRANITDPNTAQFHLTILIEKATNSEENLLLHANIYDQKVSVWPLSSFQNYPRYASLWGIRRFSP